MRSKILAAIFYALELPLALAFIAAKACES
jgi:hypothetical protein